MNWRKEKNVLILETGIRINFDFPIKAVIDHKSSDSITVWLDVLGEPVEIKNVFCISKEKGIVLWKHRTQDAKYLVGKTLYQKCVMDWAKESNVLIIENSKQVTFDYPICSILESSGMLIVSLDIPSNKVMTENVFGVSREGEILWQIERIPETATNPINRYIDLREDSFGFVVAGNWNATDVYIDAKTGKVLKTQFTK